jgi:hypothetical protein
MTRKRHPNIGHNLDELLREDGILEEVNAAALKRVFALQIEDRMRRHNISKAGLAKANAYQSHGSRPPARWRQRLGYTQYPYACGRCSGAPPESRAGLMNSPWRAR